MAVRSGGTPSKKGGHRVTVGDVKLLLCAVAFLLSVLLKYTGSGTAAELRAQAATLLHGGMDAQQVMQALGHLTEDGGLQAVFAQRERLAQAFGIETAAASAESTAAVSTAGSTQAEPYPESGYEEDLIDRTQSSFPKTVDNVVYVLPFAHENPVKGTLSSSFGMRTHPVTGKQTFHYGLDIAADKGTPIGALGDGTVRAVSESSYGKYVIIDHADGFSTLYAHCSAILVKAGAAVTRGQEIAQVGATGIATGNHLHLEVWHNGKALDPKNYVSYKSAVADT